MIASSAFSRRRFLSAAAVGVSVPWLAASRVWGANDQIVVGQIGVNNRGKDHVKQLAKCMAALCDVDQQVLAREQQNVAAAGSKCDVYGDYRRLLDRNDIDAVVIASPDHWHALMAVAACEAGKDVYCEKPLSLTVTEGRAMVQRRESATGCFRPARNSVRTLGFGWPASWFVRAGWASSSGSRRDFRRQDRASPRARLRSARVAQL